MAPRLELQAKLETLLGSRNVYYQPPQNIVMKYPCIVYELNNDETNYANNTPYNREKRYQVTAIDQDPDSLIFDKLAGLSMSAFSRRFSADNLNHTIYNLYF